MIPAHGSALSRRVGELHQRTMSAILILHERGQVIFIAKSRVPNLPPRHMIGTGGAFGPLPWEQRFAGGSTLWGGSAQALSGDSPRPWRQKAP